MRTMNTNTNNQPSCPSQPMGDCRYQMHQLRALDFAIQETVLFLDAYPHHRQALAYYHELLEQRKHLIAAYEKKCGPLTMYGNESRTSWDWTSGPWPWEVDAN